MCVSSSLLSSLDNVPIAPSVAFHARAPDAPQAEAGRDEEGDPDKRPPISVGHEITANVQCVGNSGRARVDIAADEGDAEAGGNGNTEHAGTVTAAVKTEDPDTEMVAAPMPAVKTEEDEEKPPLIQEPAP